MLGLQLCDINCLELWVAKYEKTVVVRWHAAEWMCENDAALWKGYLMSEGSV
jgi:hypothetical protein